MSTATGRARRDEAADRAYMVQVVEGSKVCFSVDPTVSTEAAKDPSIRLPPKWAYSASVSLLWLTTHGRLSGEYAPTMPASRTVDF